MSTLNLRLANSLHRHIKEIAAKEGVSINQFIASAVSEKVSALLTEDLLRARAEAADGQAFEAILDQVPARPPLADDFL